MGSDQALCFWLLITRGQYVTKRPQMTPGERPQLPTWSSECAVLWYSRGSVTLQWRTVAPCGTKFILPDNCCSNTSGHCDKLEQHLQPRQVVVWQLSWRVQYEQLWHKHWQMLFYIGYLRLKSFLHYEMFLCLCLQTHINMSDVSWHLRFLSEVFCFSTVASVGFFLKSNLTTRHNSTKD